MKTNQHRSSLDGIRGTTMFNYIKLWWKIRKLKKALWHQVNVEALDKRKYVARRPSHWLKNGDLTWQ